MLQAKMYIMTWNAMYGNIFFERRENDYNRFAEVITTYMVGDAKWYFKLDLIDRSIEYLRKHISPVANEFIKRLNSEFERLHFAY